MRSSSIPPAASLPEIVALGNAGFSLRAGGRRILFDPFIIELSGVPEADPANLTADDVILITHSHWDHLVVPGVAEALGRGATMVLPASAAVKFERRVKRSDPALRVLEPAAEGDSVCLDLPGVRVTAFRTRHGEGHNSYLVETAGLRLFDDGDNEDTRCLDPRVLGAIDVLIISTWKGAHWVQFINALTPKHWLLMHLDEDEFAACDRGKYFRDLCDQVPLPERLSVLRPGQTRFL